MKKLLIAVATACTLLSSAALADKYDWADRANACLKNKGIGDVCYVTEARGKLEIYCGRNATKNGPIAEACSAEANQATRPTRFSERRPAGKPDAPAPLRNPRQQDDDEQN